MPRWQKKRKEKTECDAETWVIMSLLALKSGKSCYMEQLLFYYLCRVHAGS